MVFRRAKRILGNDADAEDVVQEVFGLLLERGTTVDDVDTASSWFYRTTTNRSLNVLRSKSRREAREKGEHASSLLTCLPGSDPEATRLLRELVSDLHPPVIAEAAYYFYLEQMTLNEIASVLGVTRRTVANYLARFRAQVQLRIGNTPAT